MPYLTGEQLQRYRAYKQGTPYTTARATPTAPVKSQGFLGGLVSGITKPFRSVAEDVTEIGGLVLDPRRWAGKGAQVEAEMQAKGGYKPTFLTPEEYQTRRAGDPLLEALKTGAGVGAWAVPGGGTLGQAVGRGALAGGMGGFGMAKPGEELKGALTGGVTGGALGGLFQQVGVGLGKLGKKGKLGLFRKVTTKETGLAPKLLEQTKLNAVDDMFAQGLIKPGATADDVSNAFSTYIGNLTDDVGRAKGAMTPVSGAKDKVVKSLLKKFGRKGEAVEDFLSRKFLTGGRGDEPLEAVYNYFIGMTDDPTALEIAGLNKEINRAVGSFKKAMEPGSTGKAQLLSEMRKSARGLVKGEASNLLTKQSNVMKVQEAFTKVFEKPVGPRLYGLGMDVRKPTQALGTRLAGLGKLGTMGGAPLRQFGARAAPILGAGAATGEVPTGIGQPREAPGLGMEGLGQEGLGVQPTGQPSMDQSRQMILGLLSSGMKPSDVKTVVELLGMGVGEEEAADLGEVEKKFQTAAEAARQSYELLLRGGGAGKIPTITGKISEFFGGTTPSTEYRASLELATGFIRNALIGAAQTPQELARLEAAIPKPTDEPATAKVKLEALIPLLESYGALRGTSQGDNLLGGF